MTAPNDAEDTPVRRSILRNLSNTGYTVNIFFSRKFFKLIFFFFLLNIHTFEFVLTMHLFLLFFGFQSIHIRKILFTIFLAK